MSRKFSMGATVMTRSVAEYLEAGSASMDDVVKLLTRHVIGDWGELLPDEDWQANDEALEHGGRLLSAYMLNDRKTWIITESDREYTTVMFPVDY